MHTWYRTVLLFALLLFLTTGVLATTIERDFSFAPASILSSDDYDLVMIDGCVNSNDAGLPVLPIMAFTLLLPPGEELVDVEILEIQWETLDVLTNPRPASEQMPLYKLQPVALAPNPEVYQGSVPYPAEVTTDLQTGFYRGHSLASVLIHPVKWHPETGVTEQIVSIRLAFNSTATQKANDALHLLRANSSTVQALRSMNADLFSLPSYPATDELDEVNPSFMIICDEDHVLAWEEFANFKRSRGLETIIWTTDMIYETYDGQDNQMKIRNAIIDAYENIGIAYVLFGGDVQYIPCRYLYDSGADITADLYYSGLDGTWNDDNDNRWGEPGEDDLYQEVAIGRAPVLNNEMINIWITKQILYQESPVPGEMTNALMVGELLGWNVTGGDFKDDVMNGSDAWGYTTEGFPDDWTVNTLYDRDHVWSMQELFTELNSGYAIVNHVGHADVTYLMKADNPDITTTNLTNDGINHTFYIGYTQGCYCGAFEQNSITELWCSIETGAIAFISNSRYGYGSINDTNGASERFDREFFDALFAEDIFYIGDANNDSKHDVVPFINVSNVRWCYYCLNLHGDPTLDVYTGAVQELEVDLPTIYISVTGPLEVEVPGVEGALVAVSSNGTLMEVGTTGPDGIAQVPLEIDEPCDLDVVVTAHNYLAFEGQIPAILTEDGYPGEPAVSVIDTSSCLPNEMIDSGEEFLLSTVFDNVGLSDIDRFVVEISHDNPYLTVVSSDSAFEVGPDNYIELNFPASVSPEAEDSTVVELTFTIVSDTFNVVYTAPIMFHAPSLELAIAAIDDGTEGNHRFDPGETGLLSLELVNTGSGDLFQATLEMEVTDPCFETIEILSEPVTLSADDQVTLESCVQVTITESTPIFTLAWINANLNCEYGYGYNRYLPVEIGILHDDLEGGVQEWSHYSNDEWYDQWHRSQQRNSTPNGSYSWKMGSENDGNYADSLDACLQLPVIERPGAIILSFHHWMDAQLSTTFPGRCYDGGRVEYSLDGENWIVASMPGYNYSIRGNDGPFASGDSVYSGEIDWTEDHVTIPGGPGELYVRFRFGSDDGFGREGWYIDDITITPTPGFIPPASLDGELVHGVTCLAWSTPGAGLDETLDLIGFRVYRNDEMISELESSLGYEDVMDGLPQGTYSYEVSAVYDQGESPRIGPLAIEWDPTGVFDDSSLPVSWSVSAPYPNPFNPEFTVAFTLEQSTNVRATLFNILGQQVALLNDQVMTGGHHTLQFNGADLASGLYVLEFEAGPLHEHFKVLLMK